MTLSSFLIRPAQCATFTTSGLSNQVVTASPAIFIGFQASVTAVGQGLTIKNGNAGANIFKNYILGYYDTNTGASYGQLSLAPTGVDCPLGIYIDTPIIGGSPTNLNVSIYYILK